MIKEKLNPSKIKWMLCLDGENGIENEIDQNLYRRRT